MPQITNFQGLANKICKIELFEKGKKENNKNTKKFMSSPSAYSPEINPYVDYANTIHSPQYYLKQKLKNISSKDEIDFVLKAICFSASNKNNWKLPYGGYFYTHFNSKESIPPTLQRKLYKNIPDICFQERINDDFYDNFILDVPWKDYPMIYKGSVYLYSFNVAYFNEKFTKREISLLSAMTNVPQLIIDLKKSNKIQLVKLFGTKNSPDSDKSETYEFPRTREGTVKLFLYASNKKLTKKIIDAIESISEINMQKLVDCLYNPEK